MIVAVARGRLHYAWIVFGVTFFTLLAAAGIRSTPGVLGRARGGIVFGWVFASHQLGAAFAATSAGSLRTWLGDYQVAFLSAGLLCLVASGLVIRIGRASRGKSALQAA